MKAGSPMTGYLNTPPTGVDIAAYSAAEAEARKLVQDLVNDQSAGDLRPIDILESAVYRVHRLALAARVQRFAVAEVRDATVSGDGLRRTRYEEFSVLLALREVIGRTAQCIEAGPAAA